MNTYKTLLTTGATLAFALSAQAATLTFSDSVTLSNNVDNVINILKFDTANDISEVGKPTTVGATLDSVSITVTVTLTGAEVQLDNDSLSSNTATATVTNQVNTFAVNNVSGDPLNGIDLQINEQQDFTLDATSGDAIGSFDVTAFGDFDVYSPGALTGVTSGNLSGVVADDQGYTTTTLGEDIAFLVNPTFGASATFNGDNGFFQGNTPTGTYSVEVVYEYTTPVPEPSSFALIAGVLGLGAVMLRRRR